MADIEEELGEENHLIVTGGIISLEVIRGEDLSITIQEVAMLIKKIREFIHNEMISLPR